MTVTIRIKNNAEYIKANHPELIEKLELEPDEKEMFQREYLERYPFELELSNVNFCDLFRALGVANPEPYGDISATELQGRLTILKRNLGSMVEEPKQEGRILYCGRSQERVTRYYWELSKIVREAITRGESITWD